MSKENYSKPALSYLQQLELLKSRGLKVIDDEKALHLLAHLSYYRFSGYLFPLLNFPKDQHSFKIDATFEKAFQMYCFDRALKRLIFNGLEKIEISFRAKITYIYAHRVNPFWYVEKELFIDKNKHSKTLKRIQDYFKTSTTDFALSFRKKYKGSAPSWMAMETCDFGALSMLYSNLRPGKTRREVAQEYGLKDTVLISWMHCLVVIRNICAHHGRLWNGHLNIRPVFPSSTSMEWIEEKGVSTKRTYFVLAMIRYLLFTINPSSNFPSKIKELFTLYPDVSASAVGVPENAFNQKFWNN